MGEVTAISWTDHTFNPWIGCTKVSPGCDHCYAETLATTRMQRQWGPGAERRRTSVANWHLPIRWNKQAVKDGRRHRVFCASMADVFDAEVPQAMRDDMWALIRATPALDWQLLTKRTRAKWILKCLPADWGDGYTNVWLGSSIEDQATANRRIPELLAVPAAIHWLSVEPMIAQIYLCQIPTHPTPDGYTHYINPLWPGAWFPGASIDWVVVGGESGKGARPMQGEWARTILSNCYTFQVPLFFKQWGDVSPDRQVGVHHGGDVLEGRQWHEFPKEAADEVESPLVA